MNYYGSLVSKLIEEFARLPGVGQKSAQRMAFFILNSPKERADSLSSAIIKAKLSTRYCDVCCNLSDDEVCYICQNSYRDKGTIMVVGSPQDMAAYEKTNEYKGLYHVLHGLISPIDGIGPNELKIKELLRRLSNSDEIKEVIIATNSNIEGEATALYISKLLSPAGLNITRIAHGIPVGSDLEYADPITLLRALEGRRAL